VEKFPFFFSCPNPNHMPVFLFRRVENAEKPKLKGSKLNAETPYWQWLESFSLKSDLQKTRIRVLLGLKKASVNCS